MSAVIENLPFEVATGVKLYPDYRYDNHNYGFAAVHEKSVTIICTFAAIQILTSMDKVINLDHVDLYNNLYGFETLHPLVSVVDLRQATKSLSNVQLNYGLYAVFLKLHKSCDIKYGRKNYDYQDGTIVCFAPNQSVHITNLTDEIAQPVLGLLFHPDLIHGTSLGKNIRKYTFFSYSVNEALHLSEQERVVITDGLKNISMELEHAIDKHSKSLISMNIELLLNYCMRFYERQFITRNEENRNALTKFELLLNEYFENELPAQYGLPSVKYFADKICLSPNYFGDMIKKETGKTPQEHIQEKIIDSVKERITSSNETVSEIAYTLGFQYPQHLCRLFKKRVGCTLNAYRSQQEQTIS